MMKHLPHIPPPSIGAHLHDDNDKALEEDFDGDGDLTSGNYGFSGEAMDLLFNETAVGVGENFLKVKRMRGFSGKYYWGRKERETEVVGIVMIFAWMFSQEKHVKSYVDLYYSLGWDSLVCHSQFLNSFSSYRATSLSLDVLNELDEELKVRPCPVVFLSFSGGPKACMYKVIQIIDSRCPGGETLDYRLVRDCTAGFIYDSCPVDFTPDIGTPFVLSVLPISCLPRLVKWVSDGFFAGLDALFCSSFESIRAEYGQTLYSSRLEELGGDVRLLKWNSSPNVGHYQQHPDEYKGAVARLLKSAFSVYSQKIQQHERAIAVPDRAYDTFMSPQMEAAACSNDGLRKLSVESDACSCHPAHWAAMTAVLPFLSIPYQRTDYYISWMRQRSPLTVISTRFFLTYMFQRTSRVRL
ncbi:hypothetical protein AKJ16_DCAP00382 [Drosera capensis]